ncbi:hypothetical protein pipiens_002098 [Culex pipiens pipiens]|uniref:Uncharacterized protein n=1 Tax=Culex pipiens pipiens TaxID=38569 RepID=A0ABD1DKK6_CULPP
MQQLCECIAMSCLDCNYQWECSAFVNDNLTGTIRQKTLHCLNRTSLSSIVNCGTTLTVQYINSNSDDSN